MYITNEAVESINKIIEISFELNNGKKERTSFVLESIKHHSDEINQLFSAKDPHWAVETGDLMIHCMEILLMYGFDLNEMFDKCSNRFENKISKLLREKRSV